MKIQHTLSCLATVVLGLAVSSTHPAGIVAAFLLLSAFTFRHLSRRICYAAATGYYVGALWPLAVGAKNFFGPNVSVVGAIAFWAVCAVLLALPYALLWTEKTQQMLWQVPVALLVGVIPPLGLLGFASPLTASGFLFPPWSWSGFALSLAGCGLIVAYSKVGFSRPHYHGPRRQHLAPRRPAAAIGLASGRYSPWGHQPRTGQPSARIPCRAGNSSSGRRLVRQDRRVPGERGAPLDQIYRSVLETNHRYASSKRQGRCDWSTHSGIAAAVEC